MTETTRPRAVAARRMIGLTTAATTALVGLSAVAGSPDRGSWGAGDDRLTLAQASGEGGGVTGGEVEGEGEGGGMVDLDQGLQRDLSFMEGHIRAGLALYEEGDLQAAKTHMGHPIKEKYGAVSEPLAELGYSRLRDQIEAIAAATEAEAPFSEVQAAFDTARATIEEVRAEISPQDQMLGLAALLRVAGDEYTVAVNGGEISNLHEYQDSWGFVQVVEAELRQLTRNDDEALAAAGANGLDYLGQTEAAFGDLQGRGEIALDPSLLYVAAARVELEALGLS
ncbi:hypothetical protein [Roseisalinus antarcticus]|uniref:Uncharacterized protein n=1 Tax=Roseisalinus antarcticus TaxID=254357 RepID=A0A1Y5T114_9RHOB|nr:hypothetical protein [Roseisalinus antarcticus]SLN52988.1 hypothetical protein ROA7023_02340 [Roseisalinus antarcticus]